MGLIQMIVGFEKMWQQPYQADFLIGQDGSHKMANLIWFGKGGHVFGNGSAILSAAQLGCPVGHHAGGFHLQSMTEDLRDDAT